MTPTKIAIRLLVPLALLGAWGASARPPVRSEGVVPRAVERGTVLRLRRGDVDPRSDRGIACADAARASLAAKRAAGVEATLIVRCEGPDQDAWRATAAADGLDVLASVPDDALLVRGPADRLAAFAARPFVTWAGEFGPLERLDPALDAVLGEAARDAAVDVAILFVADDAGLRLARDVAAGALERAMPVGRIGRFAVVRGRFSVSVVASLIGRSEVVNVEPWRCPTPQDERTGVIVAGQLDATGKQPAGPGYLEWLAARGFTGATFDFGIDFTDSGLDTGIPDDPEGHPDFRTPDGSSRIAYSVSYVAGPQASTGDYYGHGTLNASIATGYDAGLTAPFVDGSGYRYGLGIAPFVRIGGSKIFDRGDSIVLTATYTDIATHAYRNGMRISSNSWGALANRYTVESMEFDAIVRDADPATPGNQEYTVCCAAGNAFGGGTVFTPATGKNVIAVGASESYRPDGVVDACDVGDDGADAVDDVADFSSGGPLADGRTKPDLVAPGTHVQGCASQHRFYNGRALCVDQSVSEYYPAGQTLYAWASGTSQATPVVAGAAALVRAYAVAQGWFDGASPSAAMVKALLVSATTPISGARAGRQIPDARQGFGRVALGPLTDDAARVLVDQTETFTTAGQIHVEEGDVGDPARPFRVALVWTDAPGLPNFAARVNDLDLEVRVGDVLYRGNAYTGFASTPDPSVAPDAVNTVETVTVPAGIRGPFVVTVRAATIAGDGVPGNADATDQDFALVIYNIDDGRWTPPDPPSVTSVVVKARPSSAKLTVGGARMPATTEFEINGVRVPADRRKYLETKGVFRLKGPVATLGIVPGQNQLVAIDGTLRSEPFPFTYAP